MSSVCYVTSRRVVSWSLCCSNTGVAGSCVVSWNLCCSNTGVAGSSETFAFIYQVTRHHITEESNKPINSVHVFKSCLGNILK